MYSTDTTGIHVGHSRDTYSVTNARLRFAFTPRMVAEEAEAQKREPLIILILD
jgi:hypothetical protein